MRRLLLSLCCAVSLLVGAPAMAGSPPSSPAQRAEEHFNEGRRLLAAGQYVAACRAFDLSQREEAALGTLLNLAECEEKGGMTASAFTHFSEAAEWAGKVKEDKRHQVAKGRAEALKPKLSVLRVQAPVEVSLSLDGSAWPAGVREQSADPGHHVLVASARGFRPWSTEVEIGSGPLSQKVEVPALTAELLSAPVAVVPVETVSQSRAPVAHKALLGAGAAVLTLGMVGLAYSLAVNGAVARQQPGGPDAGAPSVSRAQYESLRALYPASLVALALGAAGIAGGVYLNVAPSGASAGLGGTF